MVFTFCSVNMRCWDFTFLITKRFLGRGVVRLDVEPHLDLEIMLLRRCRTVKKCSRGENMERAGSNVGRGLVYADASLYRRGIIHT
jgi:hypothetical protein